MGIIAKQGIFGGKKIALDKLGKVSNSSSTSVKLWDAFGIKEQAEKLIAGNPLDLSDLEVLDQVNLSALIACRTIVRKTVPMRFKPVLYLPLERWLQVEDPFEVVNRSVNYIQNLALSDLVLVIGIKDFSNLELFWPEILQGIKSSIPDLKFMGPSFSELVKWSRQTLGLEQHAEIIAKCDELLSEIADIGLSELYGYSSTHGSPLVKKNSMTLNYALELDRYPDRGSLFRELVRERQEFIDLEPNSWTLAFSSHLKEVTQLERIRLLRTLILGSIIFKTSIRNPWVSFDGSELGLYSQLGVDQEVFLAVDSYTAKSLKIYELNQVKSFVPGIEK